MQTQSFRLELGDLQASLTLPVSHHVSPRTFMHCLHALFVQTKVLASNVVSLHSYVARHSDPQDNTPILLSQFQLELTGMASSLQRHTTLLSSIPLHPQEWVCYADLWRIADVRNIPAALAELQKATDLLASMYESLLSTAAAQADQSTSFYMLAEHLILLNDYYMELEQCPRLGIAHFVENLYN